MTYEKKIEIPKILMDDYNRMFNYNTLDLETLDIPKLSNIKTWTADFGNGFFADIKMNTSEEDVWSEGVLFDGNGCQVACTDVCDNLEGEWEFEVGDDVYKVNVLSVL